MSQKGIGRLFTLGVAKETTRGTAISSAAYWIPFEDLGFEEKFENAMLDQSHGIIEDMIGQVRVKNYADGSFKLPLIDQSAGLLFYSLFGGYTHGAHAGETTVYDHTFTVGENAQHQSLTMFIHDPLAGVDYSHANSVISKMEIDIEVKKLIELSISVRGQKGVSQSTFTPSFAADNYFVAQYAAFATAPTVAGAAGTLTGTGSATSTIHITGLNISTALLQIGMTVTGTNIPAGATIVTIVSATAVDLSAATTGASTSYTFGPLVIPIKSFKLTVDEDIEDQDVVGNVAPLDYLNKEFKVEGTVEAIYQNITDFKAQALATPNVPSAMIVDVKDTDVNIGVVPSHPELKITLDQVYFTDYTRPIKLKDLVYQTLKFKATYSTATSEMIKTVLTNTVASY